MRNGHDWSGNFPGIGNLQAAGSTFAGRYAAFDHPRGIQPFEVQALNAAGMDIITFYEEGGTWITGGYAAGVRAARNARQVWANAGQHSDVPLFLACDSDFSSGQLGPVYAALDGCASVIGRQNTGVYGGVAPVHCARRDGKAAYGVQAGAWRYRAGEVGVTDPYGWSPLAQVRQDAYGLYIGGTQVDHLTALAGDFGQWRRGVIVSPVVPVSQPWNPKQWDRNAVLKVGAKGTYVGYVQFVLNAAFNAKLKVDGVFGPVTEKWVKLCQGLAHLKADGIVGPATWHVLGAYVARVHRFDLEPMVKFNDIGHPQAVKDLQKALNGVYVHGHTPLVVDGAFGPKVRDCVAQYQRNRGLVVDAIVGRRTWSDVAALLTKYGK